MAGTMQFDLVSPERRLMSSQVVSVQIPSAEGDMTAMPNHAPTITTLRPGILSVQMDSETTDFVVTGGFAELGDGLSVLAEQAVPVADMDQAAYDHMVAEAKAMADLAKDGETSADAAKLLQDMIAVAGPLGLKTAS